MLLINNSNNRVDKLEETLNKYSMLGNIPARNTVAKLLILEYSRIIQGLKELDTNKQILYKTHHHIVILYDDVESLVNSHLKKIKNLNKLVDGTF